MLMFLHQKSENDEILDQEGSEFPDVEAAVGEAILSARQSMANRVLEGLAPDGWRFEIADRRGVILAVVPFKETISETGSIDPQKHRWVRIDAF